MPNHVTNIIFAPQHILDEIQTDSGVDFNMVVPMPEAVKETLESDFWERFCPEVEPPWYTWSIENWGTKWNAYETEIRLDGEAIAFNTAWEAPEPVYAAVAHKFPQDEFYALWACEAYEKPLGFAKLHGGRADVYDLHDIIDNEDVLNNISGSIREGKHWENEHRYLSQDQDTHESKFAFIPAFAREEAVFGFIEHWIKLDQQKSGKNAR